METEERKELVTHQVTGAAAHVDYFTGYHKPNGYYPYISGNYPGHHLSINLIGGPPGPSETCSSPLKLCPPRA
eukprot:3378136-Rhodomonas_salina.5